MKIATVNINNVVRRLPNLFAWLKTAKPDVVCLRELKAEEAKLPRDALAEAGYRGVWRAQKTWNGVAILMRRGEPVLTREDLPGDREDVQARYIEAAFSGVIVGCIYPPNGNPQPGPKFDYKLAWFERLIKHARAEENRRARRARRRLQRRAADADIYPSKSWDDDAFLQPESRAAFAKLLRQGWTDALRTLHPDEPMYTFWDYKRHRFERDAGLRIDHFLLSPDLAERLVDAGVDRTVRGREGASDHAPAWIVLR